MLSLALCAHNSDVVGASLEWNLSSPVINYTCGPGTFFAAHKYLHTFWGKVGWKGRRGASTNKSQYVPVHNHRSRRMEPPQRFAQMLRHWATELPSYPVTQPLSHSTTQPPNHRTPTHSQMFIANNFDGNFHKLARLCLRFWPAASENCQLLEL